MKPKMKRIWSLLLAAVLLCGLWTPALAQEKITIEFWEMSYGSDDRYTETCEKLIAQYEAENPNVTINMTYQPWDNYYQLFPPARPRTWPPARWISPTCSPR